MASEIDTDPFASNPFADDATAADPFADNPFAEPVAEVNPFADTQPVAQPVTPKAPEVDPEEDWTVAGEAMRAAVTGASDMINSIGELPQDFGLAEDALFDIDPFTGRPKTAGGQFAAAAVQFLVPYTGILKGVTWASRLSKASKGLKGAKGAVEGAEDLTKVIRLSKKQQFAKAAGIGAAADFVAFSPKNPNLTAIIREHAELNDPITEFLASDPNDPAVLNRFRNAVEGLGIGIAADQIIKLLGKGVKYSGEKAATKIKEYPSLYAKADNMRAGFRASASKAAYMAGRVEQGIFFSGKGFKHLDDAKRKLGLNKDDPNTALSLEEEARALESIGEIVHSFTSGGTVKITDTEIIKVGKSFNDVLTGARKHADDLGVDQAQFVTDFYDYIKYARARARSNYFNKATKGAKAVDEEAAISGGIPREEWSNGLDKLEAMPHFSRIEEVVGEYKQFHKELLDFVQDSGYINTASRKAMWDASDGFLAPFYREIDKGITATAGAAKLVRSAKDPVHRGSKKLTEKVAKELPPIKNMEDNILRYMSDTINAAMHNRFKGMAYKTAKEIQDADPSMADVFIGKPETLTKKTSIPLTALTKKLQGLVDEGKVDANTFEDIQGEVMDFYSKQHKNTKNLDVVFIDGKPVPYVINDQFLLTSMRTLGPQTVGEFSRFMVKLLHPAKNLLTRMTTLDPGFWAGANLVRDPFIAVIQSKSGLNMRDIWTTGMSKVFNEKEYAEYLLQGASFGRAAYGESADSGIRSLYVKSLEKLGMEMDKTILVGGTPKQTANALARAKNATFDFIAKFEHASRMTEYQALLKQGYSKRKAALAAKTVTTDFGQKGAYQAIRTLSAITPFLNASLQGLHKFGKTVDLSKTLKVMGAVKKGKTRKEAGMSLEDWKDGSNAYKRVMGYLVLPYTAVWAFNNFSDPERKAAYYDTPEEVRTHNTVIPMFKDEQGDWVKMVMPKPFEYSMFINGIEKSVDSMMDNTEQTHLADWVLGSMLRSAHVTDNSGVPLAARVPMELLTDRKFSGMPISGDLDNTIPQARYTPHTSETAIALSRAAHANFSEAGMADKAKIAGARTLVGGLDILAMGQVGAMSENDYSPVAIEHVINSYFGTIGRLSVDYFTDPFAREALSMGTAPAEHPLQKKPSALKVVTGEAFSDPSLMPLVHFWTRRFLRTGPGSSTSASQLFYDRKNEASKLNKFKTSVMTSLTEMDREDFDKVLTDPDKRVMLEQWPMLYAHGRTIANINSQIKLLPKLAEDSGMTSEELLIEQNNLLRERNTLTKVINDIYTLRRIEILEESE